ncbi:MAG: thiazole synthase, partial [Pirellulaceae bacterium]
MTADSTSPPHGDSLRLGSHVLASRLIVGTGKYDTFETMGKSLALSGTDCITVAVRRERLYDERGKNILDALDLARYILLPNTAGCYNAADAVRVARMGREILASLENPGADWVKLEVLGDAKTLLPDPIELLKATEQLVGEGFSVLCYTSDDPVIARRLKKAGATAVMPAGSPIGSGQGVLNPNNI